VNNLSAYSGALDDELVSWSAGGDRRAFDEIVIRHGPFALRVACRFIPDRSGAEDVAQEAMVRAWSEARHFDAVRARFRTWLYRIVVNLCIDQRRQIQLKPLPDDFDVEDPAAAVEEMIATKQRDAALAVVLRELPVRQRAAMILVYDEGMSGAEAARTLGLSAKAVERLLARGRAYLRERMQADYNWEGS
jgi:RNA polymerase sigma-70 factor (ECF subfamily)